MSALRSPEFLPEGVAGLLFEAHWVWWMSAAVVGAALLWVGRARAERRLARMGYAMLGLVAVWVMAAGIVVTPGERLARVHEQLAQAAKDHDFDRLASYLADDFSAPQLGVSGDAIPGDEIAARIKEYGVKESIFRALTIRMAGSQADSEVTLLTTTDMGPILTSWVLRWADVPGADWRIRRARLTRLNDEAVPEDRLVK